MKIEFSFNAKAKDGFPWLLIYNDRQYDCTDVIFNNVKGKTIYDPTYSHPTQGHRRGWVEFDGDVTWDGYKATIS
jgi:hypothetical protein